MKNAIYLSKNGEDEYINMLALGSGGTITNSDDFSYDYSTAPIVLRGILKHKIMKRCWMDRRDFYYIDSGYFGNQKSLANPSGWKYWHRIVKNDLQHGKIIPRPDDRWRQFNITLESWKKTGKKILIAAPDEKPCKFYNTTKEQWVKDTIAELKKYTDRPIEVRDRAPNRIDRIQNDTLKQALDKDVFALVTFNSNAASESVMYGIPVFTMAPCNAASPVGLQDLSQIETPYYPEMDKIYAWACHLAYGQFHINELKTGTAWRIINE